MTYDNGQVIDVQPVPPTNGGAPKGNVFVLGNSGVGKSTLINAVIGDDVAKTSFGTRGTTEELDIYESPDVPFRVIDSIGFEPSPIKSMRAVYAVRKWSRLSAKDGNENTRINVIWFCVDGTAAKLFPETIRNLSNAVRMWKSVPIIAVITKSYSQPDRARNIDMVREAFRGTRVERNLRAIVPVVAQTYIINETAFAAPEGITDLIDATMRAMPEGMQGGTRDLMQFKLARKRALAQGLIGVSVVAGATVGAVPIPIADSLVLSPLELAELNGLARLYEIDKHEDAKHFLDSIVQVGTASVVAHSAISAIKAIPGINIAASVLNAVVAASIIAALGEGAVVAFEQVYTGQRSVRDTSWVQHLMEEQFGDGFIGKVSGIAEATQGGGKDMTQMIIDLVKAAFFGRGK
ncbi:GTP-binding DUF697 domain-containing protein [Bifidobacterium criceti]|uniref:GTP-binding protein n=1 Tax=Bifidobacterium criceti TaxID=1960969 RepID=A0A2A2EGQ2_9BIFI|nr:GTP-binding DUF697 domain-containing protein [Bifidobacterium criceti]PAU68243.1 GTP-binding protein [Bifidobacterium criceti]